ncbi:hypothetical protein CTI14_68555, partial [Methylobacterium radiotolerans]
MASMQGRTAVFHALGDIVIPLELIKITSGAERVRGGRLHELLPAGLGGLDAGTDRGVPRAGRHRHPARAHQDHL